ncbi:hypothetical protein GCM10009809_40330 [Isoptericola hypogeus]|uniref:Phage L5-like integrase N-terminal domain-containing protein n=1 Tax=Isoptericola hypogeus TaxID=300179 RepID=A0ABN2JVV3_9MICO
MAEKGAARQRRESWGMLRQLPSKRWQARYTGPDGKVYSARMEDDRALTFLTKTDARAFLNQTHAAIARGEWESPEDAVRRREAEAAAARLRDVTFREYALAWLERGRCCAGRQGRHAPLCCVVLCTTLAVCSRRRIGRNVPTICGTGTASAPPKPTRHCVTRTVW